MFQQEISAVSALLPPPLQAAPLRSPMVPGLAGLSSPPLSQAVEAGLLAAARVPAHFRTRELLLIERQL